jgi:16S rRNA (uracil1498-N3)-methyltransferase
MMDGEGLTAMSGARIARGRRYGCILDARDGTIGRPALPLFAARFWKSTMAVRDVSSQRLFVADDLAAGNRVVPSDEQARYLRSVLRVETGASLLVFNGRDGEWRALVETEGRRGVALVVERRVRSQETGPDLHYLFAPLKRSRLDYMVQKAVELGVARLQPVVTRRTIAERVNLDRMRANAIEAAEQCGVLRLPEIGEPARLDAVLDGWDVERRLVLCDERADVTSPLAALSSLPAGAPIALLIGPEGGFAAEERNRLLATGFVTAISLGPRIMRADTAAVAALALINAAIGDWQ